MELLKREIYSYAVAAVNFYGFIPLRDLAKLINHYNDTTYQAKDLEEVLNNYINEDSVVQRTGRIVYQKQIFEDTNVRDIYEVLKEKPYYYPETKDEFLNYMQASYYELPEEFDIMKEFYTKWTENEDMAFMMAKDAVMAFNVDCPVTDYLEITIARLNDYLKQSNSKFIFDDIGRTKLIVGLVNLNNAVRKISLRGFTPNEVNKEKIIED